MLAQQDTRLDWYLKQIKDEVSSKFPIRYHGSIDIQINLVDGNIVSINLATKKSLKFALHD